MSDPIVDFRFFISQLWNWSIAVDENAAAVEDEDVFLLVKSLVTFAMMDHEPLLKLLRTRERQFLSDFIHTLENRLVVPILRLAGIQLFASIYGLTFYVNRILLEERLNGLVVVPNRREEILWYEHKRKEYKKAILNIFSAFPSRDFKMVGRLKMHLLTFLNSRTFIPDFKVIRGFFSNHYRRHAWATLGHNLNLQTKLDTLEMCMRIIESEDERRRHILMCHFAFFSNVRFGGFPGGASCFTEAMRRIVKTEGWSKIISKNKRMKALLATLWQDLQALAVIDFIFKFFRFDAGSYSSYEEFKVIDVDMDISTHPEGFERWDRNKAIFLSTVKKYCDESSRLKLDTSFLEGAFEDLVYEERLISAQTIRDMCNCRYKPNEEADAHNAGSLMVPMEEESEELLDRCSEKLKQLVSMVSEYRLTSLSSMTSFRDWTQSYASPLSEVEWEKITFTAEIVAQVSMNRQREARQYEFTVEQTRHLIEEYNSKGPERYQDILNSSEGLLRDGGLSLSQNLTRLRDRVRYILQLQRVTTWDEVRRASNNIY